MHTFYTERGSWSLHEITRIYGSAEAALSSGIVDVAFRDCDTGTSCGGKETVLICFENTDHGSLEKKDQDHTQCQGSIVLEL